MKKITIAVCSILFLIKSLSAQEIDVAIGAGTILPGENYCAKLRADLLIENHFSVGVQTNFYADKFTTSGFVLEPNMRIYFNNVHQKNVFYWQLSGFAGQVEHVQLYAHEIEDDVLETTLYPYLDLFTQLFFETIENKEYIFHTRTYDIQISGMGAAFGYKRDFGLNNNLFVDMNLGFKAIQQPDYIAEHVTFEGISFGRSGETIFNDNVPEQYRIVEDSRALRTVTGFLGIGYRF